MWLQQVQLFIVPVFLLLALFAKCIFLIFQAMFYSAQSQSCVGIFPFPHCSGRDAMEQGAAHHRLFTGQDPSCPLGVHFP